MLYYALMCLVVGLIAGALNLAGVSTIAVQISWVLFLIGVILAAIQLVWTRLRSRCPDEGLGRFGDTQTALTTFSRFA